MGRSPCAFIEEDHEPRLVPWPGLERDDLDGQLAVAAVAFHPRALLAHRAAFTLRTGERCAHRHEQAFAQHFQKFVAGQAGRGREIRAGLAAKLHHLQPRVHDHAGRRIFRQQHALGIAMERRLRRLARSRRGRGKNGGAPRAPKGWDKGGGARPAGEDFLPRILDLEKFARGARRLRAAQPEMPAGLQGVVQQRHHLLLEHRFEVDEQIPARDEIHPRKRRVREHIVPRKDDALANAFAHPVVSVFLHEKLPQPLRRHVLRDAERIAAHPRLLDARGIDIGREELEARAAFRRLRALGEKHRQRIRLFARRAAQRPHAHRLVARAVGEQLGENLLRQRLERLGIAEKAGDVDEHVLVERLDLARIRAQVLLVFRERLDLVHHHPPLDAPLHGVRLVVGEIDARRPSHDFRDASVAHAFLPAAVFLRRHRDVRMPRDARDFPRDVLRRQHEIHAPRGHRALRHRVMLRGFILRKGDAALSLDDLQPERAIARAARKHHPDGLMPAVLRERAEELVNPAMPRIPLLREEPQFSARDDHVAPRRDDIDMIRLDRRFIAHLAHRHLRRPREDFHQTARMIRGEMLNDDETHSGIARQCAEQFPQSLQPARGSPHPDDWKGRTVFRHGGCFRHRGILVRHGRSVQSEGEFCAGAISNPFRWIGKTQRRRDAEIAGCRNARHRMVRGSLAAGLPLRPLRLCVSAFLRKVPTASFQLRARHALLRARREEHRRCENKPAQGNALGEWWKSTQP